ncbi:MAG: UDP-N-acetylmuramate--alanine ligase [Confluentimicrobium sp.]|uniref:DUF2484 family protein n=1 Tax=Actibacterium sp. TaxID=1872125 RepID=UPI000C3690F3|nr:DUF2484 family protein [Actibacterium sp.]MBC55808.1 UDP-N-acetylmuramate--alanine ligase [Actibacterium sp.]|tara:strand:- start:4305 stop:4562 length:258 start_codon:yes stop_codon:yes gene_type:complete
MTLSLTLACLWALAATITAFLPMRLQYAPGLALLVSAPVLIGYLGWQHDIWVVLAAVAGAVSMFRRPLFYLLRRALRAGGGEGRE